MTGEILSWRHAAGHRARAIVRRFGPWLLAGPILLAAPALAQDNGAVPRPPAAARTDGVVTPPAQIDPGMARAAPHLPARSTPVLHPRTRNSRGMRIVPK